MKAAAQFADPASAQVTITLTGTLGEFEALREEIGGLGVPYYRVQALVEAIYAVSRKLRAKVEDAG